MHCDTPEALQVWLDSDGGPACHIGTMTYDRCQIRLRYASDWPTDVRAAFIHPGPALGEISFSSNPTQSGLAILMDSSPDRWGRTLMRRCQALLASKDGREARRLSAWDDLIGVQDLTRQGALRFCRPGSDTFLGDDARAAPPATSLPDLQAAAIEWSRQGADEPAALDPRFGILAVAGASLGGARPKASFMQPGGTLWLAKFPGVDDKRDIGAWEWVAHTLAARAGVDVPSSALLRLRGGFHTFCVQRFDRVAEKRRLYTSALAVLGKERGEDASYL